ncbi:MAG: chitobiase/beta-hexosaminidase C-terminal domain-containing protein [bacterium]
MSNGGTFMGFPGAMPTRVANPTFAPAPGSYVNSVNVTLASTTTDAEIRYTTDGSDPDMTSTLYANPILIVEHDRQGCRVQDRPDRQQ